LASPSIRHSSDVVVHVATAVAEVAEDVYALAM
jgi:hypothetical protein